MSYVPSRITPEQADGARRFALWMRTASKAEVEAFLEERRTLPGEEQCDHEPELTRLRAQLADRERHIRRVRKLLKGDDDALEFVFGRRPLGKKRR